MPDKAKVALPNARKVPYNAPEGYKGGYMTAISAGRAKAVVLCVLAMAMMGVKGQIQNGFVYPLLVDFFPVGREIESLINIAFLAGIVLLVSKKPSLLDARIALCAALVSCASAGALIYAALTTQNPLLMVSGTIFFQTGHAWASMMLGMALCSLRSVKDVAVAAAFGMILGDLVWPLLPSLPLIAALVLYSGVVIASMALTWKASSRFLDRVRLGHPVSELELANPQAFLAPVHMLFLCVLVFSVASGYALAFNEVGNAPNIAGVRWVPLVPLAAWLALRKHDGQEDTLFSFSVLMVIAGFLAAPFTFGDGASAANSLLWIGADSFNILSWIVVAAVGQKNPFALLPTLGILSIMKTAGVMVGAVLGHVTNEYANNGTQLADLIAALMLFAFVATLWTVFRGFSFERTIKGIAPVRELRYAGERGAATAGGGRAADAGAEAGGQATGAADSAAGEAGPARGVGPEGEGAESGSVAAAPSIEECCEAIGEERGLTKRETEIFAMLARGRNGGFIQEHYVISYNTVKTHVKRIYKKLDVHSQQELIDLVEAAEDSSRNPAAPCLPPA